VYLLRGSKANQTVEKEKRLIIPWVNPPDLPFLRREKVDNTINLRRRGYYQSISVAGSYQGIGGGSANGQSNVKDSFVGGASEHKTITYPHYVRYELRHPRDCFASLGRCYICRQDGHRWRDHPHLGHGCYYYGRQGNFKKDCPKMTEYVQR